MCTCSALCGTPKRQVTSLTCSGVLLIGLLAFGLPALIRHVIERGVCDQLCVPDETAPAWQLDNWRTNFNESMHPAEILSFSFFNFTNPREFVYGAKPIVDQVGPYFYRVYSEKFNLEHRPDLDQILYEQSTRFVFQRNMTAAHLDETDVFMTVNAGFAAGVEMFWTTKGLPFSSSFLQCANPPIASSDGETCLFAPLSVTQLLFSSFSSAAGVANFIIFNMTENPTGRIDPTFHFFLSCDTPAQCHEATVSKHSFGLGGSCVPEPFALSFKTNTKLCKSPEAAGTVNATKWAAYTGRGDVARLGQLAGYLGNSTFYHWNRPVSIEGAHGSLNFRPLLTRDDTLTLWEDAMMRPIDMRFVRDSSVLGIETLRFQPADLVFSGQDPIYNYAGIPIPRGMINVSSAGPIRFGSPASAFASLPFFAGADPKVAGGIVCRNCPSPAELAADGGAAWLPHIDVEPTTGAVLSGQKFGQVNVLVGQRGRFDANCSLFIEDPTGHPYACMRDTYLPVFWYQQKGALTPEIAAVIAPNIKVAATARTVMRASVYVGAILGGACLLAAAWVVWTARQRKMDEHGLDELEHEEGHEAQEGEDEEQAQTAAGSVGDYATLPTHDAAMDADAEADANSNASSSSSSSQRRRGSDVALVPPRRKSQAASELESQ